MPLIVDEMNEILAEDGEPPTSLEELERAGIVEVPVSWDDEIEAVEVLT